MKSIPELLKRYFWDIDFGKLDFSNRPGFIIERVLEYGDEKAVAWLMENFPRIQIISVVEKSRRLTKKSANFWAFMFEIEKEKVKCLSRSFQETRKQFWPY
ncbi:MAG: hypothetical protein P9M00_09780 [Candidatus Tritonobacter lacicola]|nr:hypothetical protein [Candidatus Tritonobacter lacicola]